MKITKTSQLAFFLFLTITGCHKPNPTSNENVINISGITETDGCGNFIGNIDQNDWTRTEIPWINRYVGNQIMVQPIELRLSETTVGNIDTSEVEITNFIEELVSVNITTENPFACSPQNAAISPGDSCLISVYFTLPDTLNTYNQQLFFLSNEDSLQIDLNGKHVRNPGGIDGIIGNISEQYEMYPAYPNPASSMTIITFAIHEDCLANLKIIDSNGSVIRELVNKNLAAGYHEVEWDLTDTSGSRVDVQTYRVLLTIDDFTVYGDIQVQN